MLLLSRPALIAIISVGLGLSVYADETPLFQDLALVETIDKRIRDDLPFFYNYSLVGGYFNMPSARMNKVGTIAVGGGTVPPYNIYGINFQPFDHMELSANYRVFKGIPDPLFGKEGFGDEAERIGNIKIALHLPEDGFPGIPQLAFGADDFFGTKRFNSQYVVMTKKWIDYNIELSVGFGRRRLKGFFGGMAWTPFRQTGWRLLKNISLIAEYDAYNYKRHISEHPKGRTVHSRINAGVTYLAWDMLQLSVNSVRGERIAASASLRYPLGTTEGFLPKVGDPSPYVSPIDTEPLGAIRPERDFAQELAYAFSDQGLDVYTVYLIPKPGGGKELWIKMINNRYRKEEDVRTRLEHVLGALLPSDISGAIVVIEADGVSSQAYRFRTEDLTRYRQGLIGDFEMATLSPMREAVSLPSSYDAALLFKRTKDIWTFTIRPQLQTFFGSSKGKFKYSISAVASPEGYLFDEIYYRFQVGYMIKSSLADVSSMDRINPSQILNVRSDTILYYQTNKISIQEAYLQKSWNLGRGLFYRLAGGYFEPAYGGGATELLYYPVNSDWAIGIEGAVVLKRRYEGIKFTHKIRKLHGHTPEYVPFTGVQYFLNLYYTFQPLNLDFKLTIGQFLAKDKGARLEVGRIYPSGIRLALWYTVTNAHDRVNGQIYHDKGFMFSLPLDLLLKQSSRTYVGYAMAAWLRDVGATAETGKKLYFTLREERYY